MTDPIALSNYVYIRTVIMGAGETKTPKDIVGDDAPSLWDLLGIVGTTEAGVLFLGRRPDPKPKSKGLTAEEIAGAQSRLGL
jgi:hypothetical protein